MNEILEMLQSPDTFEEGITQLVDLINSLNTTIEANNTTISDISSQLIDKQETIEKLTSENDNLKKLNAQLFLRTSNKEEKEEEEKEERDLTEMIFS